MNIKTSVLAAASLVMAATLTAGCVYDAGGYGHNPLWGASSSSGNRGHANHQQPASNRRAQRQDPHNHGRSAARGSSQRPQSIDNGPIIRSAPKRQAGSHGSNSSRPPRVIKTGQPIRRATKKTKQPREVKRPQRPVKAKTPVRKTPRKPATSKPKTPQRVQPVKRIERPAKQQRAIKRTPAAVKLEKPVQAVRPVTPTHGAPSARANTLKRETVQRVQPKTLERVHSEKLRVLQ